MKIGFIAPQSIAIINGGVRTQALMTAHHLKNLEVDIHFISPWDDISNVDADIFHVFSASTETLGVISRLKEQNRKIVLSPVIYSNRSAKNIRRLLSIEERLSAVSSGIRSEFGIKKEACRKADLLLPNTTDEAYLISHAFGISGSDIAIVPNGVELRFAESSPDYFIKETGLNDFILFAGQVSAPRKNVLNLLKAVKSIERDVVIIGDFDNSEYSRACLKLAAQNSNVHLMDSVEHTSELLASAYAACHVFVLPSQFETPGIAALEAALAGANIAITEVGGTRDYFVGYAEFISPYSIQSIKTGIEISLQKKQHKDLADHIAANFTWQQVAEQTLAQYKKVLG